MTWIINEFWLNVDSISSKIHELINYSLPNLKHQINFGSWFLLAHSFSAKQSHVCVHPHAEHKIDDEQHLVAQFVRIFRLVRSFPHLPTVAYVQQVGHNQQHHERTHHQKVQVESRMTKRVVHALSSQVGRTRATLCVSEMFAKHADVHSNSEKQEKSVEDWRHDSS